LSSSDDEADDVATNDDGELKILTEIWVEPQVRNAVFSSFSIINDFCCIFFSSSILSCSKMPLKNYSKMGFVVAHKDSQNKVALQIGWSRQDFERLFAVLGMLLILN